MKISQLLTLLSESGLSPERFGEYLGISGMTLRRWMKLPPTKELPKRYERSVFDGMYQLIVSGHLAPNSPTVTHIVEGVTPMSFQAALKGLGVTYDIDGTGDQTDRVVVLLSQVGLAQDRKDAVDNSTSKIESFEQQGNGWKGVISRLLSVIRSKQLAPVEKLVAYGALFYLLTPFDLIPDHLPGLGLIDDFGILSIATVFYTTKFAKLVTEKA